VPALIPVPALELPSTLGTATASPAAPRTRSLLSSLDSVLGSLLKRLRLETCTEKTIKLLLSQFSVVCSNDLNQKPTKKRQPSNRVVNSVSSPSLKKPSQDITSNETAYVLVSSAEEEPLSPLWPCGGTGTPRDHKRGAPATRRHPQLSGCPDGDKWCKG
jgi:hypothetical protein